LGFNKPIIWYFNFTTIENQTWQICWFYIL
jgi:hypothetical protein